MISSYWPTIFIFIVKAAFYETDTKFCTAVKDIPPMDDPAEHALNVYSLRVLFKTFVL